jgi:hypothetical protein
VRAKAIAALLVATALLPALATPASSSAAKEHLVREPASVSVEVRGAGADGFHLIFLTVGSRGNVIWMTKQVSPGGEEIVGYFVRSHGRAAFDAGALDANLGRLGRFRGHFIPTSTKTRKPQNGCTGDPTATERGFFVGSFSFHGEHGYTTVHSHRERGTVTTQGATSCPMPTAPRYGHERHRPAHQTTEQKERRQNEFRLVAGDSGADLLFRAELEESGEEEEGSPTNFQASVTEEVGRMEVSRSASAIVFGDAAASTFQTPNLAEPLAEASLAPPAPFSGSATFHLKSPKTASWTGDLAVELPGLGELPLTGEDIHAGLCKGPSHCTETLPKSLAPFLEGGGGLRAVVVGVSKDS